MTFSLFLKKFYCPQCKEPRAMPHPYHGGCMKCGHKLKINPEWKKKHSN